MLKSTSATLTKLIDALMLSETRMSKVKQFRSITDIMVQTKDGRSFTLTRRQRLKQRDLTKNLDSTSTDHSTLSLNFHSTELLSVLEPTILF